LKSYFFLPASRLHKLTDIKKANVDEVIIDFEDAILSSEIDKYFNKLESIENITSYWFRIPLRTQFKEEISIDYINKFKSIGVKYMVLPKIKAGSELINIIKQFKDLKFILLIEHPRLLLEIQNILMYNKYVLKSVLGIGIGSHDLMTFLKAKHNLEQLNYPRKQLLYIAKAYGLVSIDIASMNVYDEKAFVEEVKYGLDNGFDGKFLIHPTQLKWFQNQLLSDKVLLGWAKNVINHLPDNYNGESIAPFILNDEVIEKPHALRALEIIRKYKNEK